MKKPTKRRTAGGNRGESEHFTMMDITQIKLHPMFANLLPIDRELLASMTLDMRCNGFYESQPLTLVKWPGLEGPVLGDGHARLKAAFDAGIHEVPVVIVEFRDEMQALQHCMSLQTKRRTTNDAALYRLCEQLDKLMARGRGRKNEGSEELPTRVGNYGGRSASARSSAEALGCNYKIVEKIRKIRKDGTPEIQEAVKNDKVRISTAYTLIRNMEKGVPEEQRRGQLSASHIRSLKSVMSRKNFTGLKGLGGDLASHLDKAVELYLRQQQDNRPTEEPAAQEPKA